MYIILHPPLVLSTHVTLHILKSYVCLYTVLNTIQECVPKSSFFGCTVYIMHAYILYFYNVFMKAEYSDYLGGREIQWVSLTGFSLVLYPGCWRREKSGPVHVPFASMFAEYPTKSLSSKCDYRFSVFPFSTHSKREDVCDGGL